MRYWSFLVFTLFALSASPAQMQDVPPTHWAYQAIRQLIREGLLEGYPDRTFRPNETVTRAQFAQAIARAYQNLTARIAAAQQRLERLSETPITQPTPQPDATRETLRQLQQEVEALRGMRDAVDTLQRLAQEFEPELRQQKLVVEDLRDEWQSLEERVRALERRFARFTGEVHFGSLSTHSFDKRSAYTLNGSEINPSGKFLQSFVSTHEMVLRVNQAVSPTINARATMIFGNYLPYVRAASRNADIFRANRTTQRMGNTDFAIWEAVIETPLNLFGQNFQATIGRYPLKLSRYTFQRIEPDYYLDLSHYRDGAYRVDGAKLDATYGALKVSFFFGSNWGSRGNQTTLFPISFANHNSSVSAPADQFAGLHLRYRTQISADIPLEAGFTYLAAGLGRNRTYQHINRTVANNVDRADVLGLTLQSQVAEIPISIEYAQSILWRGDSRAVGGKNRAFDVNAAYRFTERWDILIGYREIDPYFVAPGNWGRIGYLYNPSDIKGSYLVTNYTLSERLQLRFTGDFYNGRRTLPFNQGYQNNDRLNRYILEARYQLNDRWRFEASYENVRWEINSFAFGGNRGRPEWNYLTLRARYDLGKDIDLNFLYQMIDANGKGVPALSGGPSPTGNRAGVFAAQFGMQF